MTPSQLMTDLGKHFNSVREMNIAVRQNRENQPNWNWYDSAKNLLIKLEGESKCRN